MHEQKTTHIKRKVAVAAAALVASLTAANMTAMAFNEYYHYSVGPNDTEEIARFVPGANKIYLNTRPQTGGSVNIELSGAASARFNFPISIAIPDQEVSVSNPDTYLHINASAPSTGAAGDLHVWSN